MKKLFLTGVAALSLFNTPGARADGSFPTRLVWQCGKATVTWSMNEVPNHEYPRSWFSYQVTGIEKPNNRFGLDDDGLYMNGKLCWPVEPVTCLRPDGTAERCESRQVPLPRPRPEDAPAPVPVPKTALYYEPGGIIRDQIERWQRIAQSDNDVEIRGECMSACTLIMAYVPNERICFGEYASLQFHAAGHPGQSDMGITRWMFSQYPPDIRNWLKDLGAPEKLIVEKYLILNSAALWNMGYRKCEPDPQPPPMTILRSSKPI